jgi:hypothetical protein
MSYADERGEIAYKAYQKAALQFDDDGLAEHALAWQDLPESDRECWIAAAESVHQNALLGAFLE